MRDVENRVAETFERVIFHRAKIFRIRFGDEEVDRFVGSDHTARGVDRFLDGGVVEGDRFKNGDGVRFRANADRVDHADETRALEFFRRGGERGVDFVKGHRFERKTRVEVQLFVGKGRDERGNRLRGSVDRKAFDRDVLVVNIFGGVAGFFYGGDERGFVGGRLQFLPRLGVRDVRREREDRARQKRED